MRALWLPSTAAGVTRRSPASERAVGTGAAAPEGTGEAQPSCFCRGFWILKALIAQHLIWRLKPAMETRNYLKYVFSSFLGREEEKLVSKKLQQVHNSPSEPRSSFHPSSRSPAPTASSRQTLLCSLWKALVRPRYPIHYPYKAWPGQMRAEVKSRRERLGWGSSSCSGFWGLTALTSRQPLEQREWEKSYNTHMGGTCLLSTIVEQCGDTDGQQLIHCHYLTAIELRMQNREGTQTSSRISTTGGCKSLCLPKRYQLQQGGRCKLWKSTAPPAKAEQYLHGLQEETRPSPTANY